MTLHIPEGVSTRIDWRPFTIMDTTMPPRDPDDEEAEDEEDDDEEESQTDEPPLVREPDED
jgi:hypothetical protein